MHLSPDDVALLEATEEIEIETCAQAGSPVHSTIIWAVTDGLDAYIRSFRGPTARWYREITANPVATVHVADRRLAVRAVAADDPESIERTSRALERKYASDSATQSMLAPMNLPTTLRLEPA